MVSRMWGDETKPSWVKDGKSSVLSAVSKSWTDAHRVGWVGGLVEKNQLRLVFR